MCPDVTATSLGVSTASTTHSNEQDGFSKRGRPKPRTAGRKWEPLLATNRGLRSPEVSPGAIFSL